MPTAVSELLVRVNYSETDQMGVVYHARYVVWLDMARTEHLRLSGTTYRELEERGFFLAVGELTMRFRQPAHYDDVVRVRCWVREVASRRVTFGYALEAAESGGLLATAETRMMCLNRNFSPTRIPDDVMKLLHVVPDPVRI
ncbi:MAG TPA: thioesterase family protein [Gemmatimonadales bacterium]|nr:thioesterase family protein [Gemmatimonadales bacterium]